MIKKSIVWLLGLAFLNTVMTPEFVFAEQSFGSIGGEIEPTGEQKALILGGGVTCRFTRYRSGNGSAPAL